MGEAVQLISRTRPFGAPGDWCDCGGRKVGSTSIVWKKRKTERNIVNASKTRQINREKLEIG